MTKREYNSIKKKLLQGDKQAFHDLCFSLDEEINERTLNDPEIMAYLEAHELSDFLTDEEKEAVENIKSITAKYLEELAPIGDVMREIILRASGVYVLFSDYFKETQPYYDEIFSRPEYANLTAKQLTEPHTDENGEEYTLFQRIQEEVKKKREEERESKGGELLPVEKKQLPGNINLRKLLQAKDAANMISIKGAVDTIWELTKSELAAANNQFSFLPPEYRKYGAVYDTGNDTYLTFAFNLDEVEGDFDSMSIKYKAIHDAVENLRLRGYRRVSLTDIFNNSALSKGNPPTSAELKYIYEALNTMRSIKVLYDGTHDYESFQNKLGDYVLREGRLLDIQGFDYLVSDKQLKSIIVLLGDMPAPLFDTAIRKGQFYQVPKKVLQTPLPKNDNMLRLQAYMIESIEYMKDPKKNRSKDILLETLLTSLKKKGNRVYKERLISNPGYLNTLLTYWKKIGYIKGFEIQWDRVTIKIGKTTPKLTEKP